MLSIEVKKLYGHAAMPTRGYHGDAGWDLYALEDTEIPGNSHAEVPTGIAICPPEGHFVRITGRSSTSKVKNLHVIEGIIDHGYRGQLFIRVHNPLSESAIIRKGERPAQMIVQQIVSTVCVEVSELPPSDRGDKGFGSTGR